ncbi:type II secretion system protein D [Rubritalea squalenifaciens DSM 18772]|uniref:Type II secretion system protein D n=1 Tax=Rubritalea squalenifaciens DSM 18772 TaxID=1123071 RepID=A0A1M6H1D4_9BACT|nr:secretin N-terminal domain-containing protein [Rubritalea squalenifaciens]SHJ15956.1 type II secretion system protein D [Rubritalea squalenifaciens DSM 18772]
MRYTLMMFALAGALQAQQPGGGQPPVVPEQPPAVDEPAQPQPPAPAAQGQQPARPGGQAAAAGVNVDPGDQILENGMQEILIPGDRIAELYRKFTGKRVIFTQAAIAKKITVNQPGRMTYREAAQILEKTALLEGLVFVPSGEHEVKLVMPQNGKAFKVYTELADLPVGDEIVTYVMSFKHIATDEAMNVFQTVVKQFHPNGSIVPVANTATLLITENTAIIRTLIKLKQQIDIPQEIFKRQTIYLENGDAEQVAEEVQTILDFSAQFNVGKEGVVNNAPQGGNNANNRNNNNNNRRNNGRNASTAGENGVLVKPIARTNSILIIARPIDIEYAKGIIEEFDRPSRSQNYYKRRLHFLSVSEFLEVARNAIQRGNNSVSDEGSGGGGRGNTGRNSGGLTTGGGQGGQGQGGASLSENDLRSETPEDDLIGKTHIIAHNSINTIIVNGPPQSIKIIDDLINEMDISSEQVQITAIFGRYNLNGDLDFGVDFARTYQTTRGADSGFAINNRTGYPVLLDPSTLTDAAALNTAAVGGLSIYGQIGEHFFPTLRAMESTGRFKVLAKPTVFTTNNKKATLSSGQRIAVPTNTLSQNVGVGGNVSQSTNIEYEDVVLKLEVIPLVNSENEVTLTIAFKNDTVSGSQLIDGNEVPTISTEELVTSVTVPNKGTVVLGGLITETNSTAVSGIPILSRIPGLGRLFSSERTSESRDELVIFIQPRIVSGPGSLGELQDFNRSQSRLADELMPESGVLPPLPDKQPVQMAPQPVKKSSNSSSRFRGLRR